MRACLTVAVFTQGTDSESSQLNMLCLLIYQDANVNTSVTTCGALASPILAPMPKDDTSDFTMVIHHVIRCCCVFIPSSSSGGSSAAGNPSQTTVDSILKNCPPEIVTMGEPWMVLYVCIICNDRLPGPNEIFMKKKIGEWAATIRAHQYAGTLKASQAAALAKMPLWPQVRSGQPMSEKTKLLS